MMNPETNNSFPDVYRGIEIYENHLRYYTKKAPSRAGLRVAVLLDDWQGLHHFEQRQLGKVDWSNPLFIALTLGPSGLRLSTFDFNDLTRLVFLAHDHAIRVEIVPSSQRTLKLIFHPRTCRFGPIQRRHPYLEDALSDWRKRHAGDAVFEEANSIQATEGA